MIGYKGAQRLVVEMVHVCAPTSLTAPRVYIKAKVVRRYVEGGSHTWEPNDINWLPRLRGIYCYMMYKVQI